MKIITVNAYCSFFQLIFFFASKTASYTQLYRNISKNKEFYRGKNMVADCHLAKLFNETLKELSDFSNLREKLSRYSHRNEKKSLMMI